MFEEAKGCLIHSLHVQVGPMLHRALIVKEQFYGTSISTYMLGIGGGLACGVVDREITCIGNLALIVPGLGEDLCEFLISVAG